MGPSISKSTINSLTASISNIAMSTVMSCETAVDQSQTGTVTNTGIKLFSSYKYQQKTDVDSKCFADMNMQADLQNKIIEEMKNSSEATSVGIMGAFGASASEAETNLTNLIQSTVTMENIQKSYSLIKQNQGVSFSNSGFIVYEQADIEQGATLFAAATLKVMDSAGIFNDISTYVDQQSTATVKNPLDAITNAIASIGTIWAVVIICIVGVVIFGIYSIFKKNPSALSDLAKAGMLAAQPAYQQYSPQYSPQYSQQYSQQQMPFNPPSPYSPSQDIDYNAVVDEFPNNPSNQTSSDTLTPRNPPSFVNISNAIKYQTGNSPIIPDNISNSILYNDDSNDKPGQYYVSDNNVRVYKVHNDQGLPVFIWWLNGEPIVSNATFAFNPQ